MKILDSLDAAESFVAQQQALGVDCRWDNYDIVFFRAAEQGFYSRNGSFRNGVWGFDNRFPVTSKGTWEVDSRNVKHPRVSRD